MLDLHLTRDTFTPASTTGVLLWDGLPFGFVLEDVDRGLNQTDPLDTITVRKLKGRTAIPAGRYQVGWVRSPSRGVFTPRLVDVPGFRGILIHAGNDAADSEGCLLPGLSRGPDVVTKSRIACEWIYPRIEAACRTGEVWITIDRATLPP